MVNKKELGSFYTPPKTVSFMRRYVCDLKGGVSSLLEPSAGDGRFLDEFLHCADRMLGVELNPAESSQLRNRFSSENCTIVGGDFLDYAAKEESRFGLIVGNPPYINIKNMSDGFLEKARELACSFDLSKSVVQNAWVAFVLAAMELLDKGGVIFFVLPFEFLQVQYAEKLRALLEEKFNTIHILTFREKMFPEIEQETCLVYLTNQAEALPYISYKQFDRLDAREPESESRIERNKPLKKWSNAVLSDDQIALLKNSSLDAICINEMGVSSPGIVTAGNSYFVLSKAEVDELRCKNFVLPIVTKGSFVRGRISIDDSLIRELAEKGEKVYMLDLKDVPSEKLSKELKNYLDEVGSIERNGKKLKEGYKCSRRNPWYGIPVIDSGEVCFFKRYDELPHVCLNESLIHTTDIAYGLRLKSE